MNCYYYGVKSHFMSKYKKKKLDIPQTEEKKKKKVVTKIDFKKKKKKDKTTIMKVEKD
jgi:hypothetical protein